MSARTSQSSPVLIPPTDGNIGKAPSTRSTPPAMALSDDETERKRQIRGILDKGTRDIEAGVGYTLDEVLAEADRRILARLS